MEFRFLKLGITIGVIAMLAAPVRAETPPPITPEQLAALEKLAEMQNSLELYRHATPEWIALIVGSTTAVSATAMIVPAAFKVVSGLSTRRSIYLMDKATKVGQEIIREWGPQGKLLKQKLLPVIKRLERTAELFNGHLQNLPNQSKLNDHLEHLLNRRLRGENSHLVKLPYVQEHGPTTETRKWLIEFDRRFADYQSALRNLQTQFQEEMKKLQPFAAAMRKSAQRLFDPVTGAHTTAPEYSIEDHPNIAERRVGRLDFYTDGAHKELARPNQLLNQLRAPVNWCESQLERLVPMRNEKRSQEMKVYLSVGATGAMLAGGTAAAYWGYDRLTKKGQNPQVAISKKKEQDRVQEIRQIWKEQEPSTLAQKLAERRNVEKDPELNGIYKILRDVLRKELATLSGPLAKKADRQQLVQADYYERYRNFHADDEFANKIIDAVLSEVALGDEFKVTDPARVEELLWAARLVHPELNERFMMMSFGSFSKHLWPKFSLKKEDYEVNVSVIQGLVKGYTDQLGAWAVAMEKEREEAEKKKAAAIDPNTQKVSLSSQPAVPLAKNP